MNAGGFKTFLKRYNFIIVISILLLYLRQAFAEVTLAILHNSIASFYTHLSLVIGNIGPQTEMLQLLQLLEYELTVSLKNVYTGKNCNRRCPIDSRRYVCVYLEINASIYTVSSIIGRLYNILLHRSSTMSRNYCSMFTCRNTWRSVSVSLFS